MSKLELIAPKAIAEATERSRWLQLVTKTILKWMLKRGQVNHSLRGTISSYRLERKPKVTS